MDTRFITAVVIIASCGILIVYDLFVALNKRRGDTISEVIRDYTIFPVIPATLGALLGHWTLLGFRIVDSMMTGLFILLGIGAIMAAWSVAVRRELIGGWLATVHNALASRPYISALIGYLLGGYLWGQGPVV